MKAGLKAGLKAESQRQFRKFVVYSAAGLVVFLRA
jgi:hypothetical protein